MTRTVRDALHGFGAAGPGDGRIRFYHSGWSAPRPAVGSDQGRSLVEITTDLSNLFPTARAVVLICRDGLLSEARAVLNGIFDNTYSSTSVEWRGSGDVEFVAEPGTTISTDGFSLRFGDGWRVVWLSKTQSGGAAWVAAGDLAPA